MTHLMMNTFLFTDEEKKLIETALLHYGNSLGAIAKAQTGEDQVETDRTIDKVTEMYEELKAND